MKNYKTLIFTAMMGFPLSFSAQTAPSLKELVDAAMSKDAAIEQQNLESKANGLDQQKLKDIFLPKVEISGKGEYLNATAKFLSPEIAIPAIKPIFPGAVFQKELLTIILLCRVLMQPQKLKQKRFFILAEK